MKGRRIGAVALLSVILFAGPAFGHDVTGPMDVTDEDWPWE